LDVECEVLGLGFGVAGFVRDAEVCDATGGGLCTEDDFKIKS